MAPTPLRRLVSTTVLVVMAGAVGWAFFAWQGDFQTPTPRADKEVRSSILSVETWRVAPKTFELSIPATGTLLPKESITLVSEVSRRLLRVHAKEGQTVKKGTVLFELDSSMLLAQRNKLAVELEQARRTTKRQQELLAESVVSAAEAETAQASEDALRAEIQRLNVEISKSTIHAPFAGVLGLRHVSEGAWVTPETPLITLQDTSALKVDFQIPERHAGTIRIGSAFLAHIEGLARPIPGEVTATEPSVDTASRSLSVRGLVKPESGAIPGAFAKIEIVTKNEGTIMVPALAVVPSVKGRSVFVVREGKAKEVPVEIGVRTPDEIQVLSGLEVGEEVIVSNLLRVQDGGAVNVAK